MSKRTLQLVESALRLSAHVLQREPDQLAGQLSGRLRLSDLGLVRVKTRKSWLRPLTPSLESAGGALLRSFEAPRGVRGNAGDAGQRPWCVTADNRRLVAGCGDGRIRMWDLQSGELLLNLERNWSKIPAIALDPSCSTAVTSGRHGGLLRWDLETGRVVGASVPPKGLSPGRLAERPDITTLSLTPDGKRIFSGNDSGGLCVWDAVSLQPLRRFRKGKAGSALLTLVPPEGVGLSVREGYPGVLVQCWDLDTGAERGALRIEGKYGVVAVACTPDGRRLAAYDDRMRIWDLGLGRTQPFAVERDLSGFAELDHEGVLSLAFSHDGQRLAAGGGGGVRGGAGILRVWDLETGNPVRALEGHDDTVRAVLWDSEGLRLLSASDDGTVKLWDLTTDAGLDYGRGHAHEVHAVATSPVENLAASAAEGDVKLWSLETGLELATMTYDGDPPHQIAFSPDGGLLALRADDFWIWDVGSGREVASWRGDDSGVFSFAFDRRWIAAVSEDIGGLLVWDLEAPAAPRVFKGPDLVRSLALVPDRDALVALLDRDPSPRVWDTKTGTVLAALAGHHGGSAMEDSHGWVSAVAALPNTHSVVVASYEGTLGLWDLDTGLEAATVSLGGAWAESLAAMPDGTRLICGCGDRRIRIVDLASRTVVGSIEGHEDRIRAVAVTYDGRRAVSGGDDGIHVWELAERRAIGHIDCNHDVEDLALSPDGRTVFVAGAVSGIQAWDLASGRLVRSYEERGGHGGRLVASADGTRLISAGNHRRLRAWSVQTGALVWEVAGVRVGALLLSDDGRCLYSGGPDGMITMRDPATGQEIEGAVKLGNPELTIVPASAGAPATTASFVGHWTLRRGSALTALAPPLPSALMGRPGSPERWAAGPGGQRVVTAVGDRVTLLGASGARPIASLSLGGRVTALALSPDETSVIVVTGSGRVHLLRLEAPTDSY